MLRRTTAAFLPIIILACAAGGTPTSFVPTSQGQFSLTIRIENRHFSDATAYAFHAGQKLRLGRVTGKTTERFTFRWSAPSLQVIIDFVGSGERVSGQLDVEPGLDDNLLLIIGSRGSLWIGRGP